jgi:outer membrane lipoprotein-sorting protein
VEYELALRRGRGAGRRRQIVFAGTAAATAALVALAMTALTLLGGSEAASAADVRAAVSRAFSQARTLSAVAVFVTHNERGAPRRWPYAFTIARDGAYRVEDLVGGTVWASDWSTNAGTVAYGPAGGPHGERYGRQLGLPLGSPDADPFAFFNRGFASIDRGLGEAGNPQVRETEYRGRPAWLLRAAVRRARGNPHSGDRLDIVVDQESGIPVRVAERLGGRIVGETLVEDIRMNVDVPRHRFRIEAPAGASVRRDDYGFRRVPLGAVAPRVGYRPLVPAWLPPGYELAEVQIAMAAAPAGGAARLNPPSRAVVMLGYRRGLEYFTLTTRRTGVKRSRWSDPFGRPGSAPSVAEPVIIAGGSLDGVRAELVTDARSVPHIWAVTDKLVVTVGGDLVRDELLRVAGSLQ